MDVPFLDLNAQYRQIKDDIDRSMAEVVNRSSYILGPELEAFETAFAEYVGSRYAIGVGSGLVALELALRAAGVGAGDEVVTAANTFVATAMAISAVGAVPVLVDIDPNTYNMSPDLLPDAITSRTRAIMPVHLYGQPADMDEIMEVAKRHNLLVIEDAAQAQGSRYKGRPAGSLGHAGAFSFYPGKNLGAFGDGGMVVTNDSRLAEHLRRDRNYGQKVKYEHVQIGTNSRLDNLQAAVLRVKLPHLDRWNGERRKNADHYMKLLSDAPVTPPPIAENRSHVFHLFVVQVDGRSEVREKLRAKGVDTGIHYPIPIYRQKAYEHMGYRIEDFPATEKASGRILSLPMYAELRESQIEYVSETLQKIVS